ncbi:hypothetical protein JOF56_004422 [Kibdelosporangium banguiense]|uniref:Uncharacterized protein n=1 Tax=Kibdelosporangium banguiense TaxID=1365924 RepID=A0ABS4THX5_9PSEU|nr:hypothetical protein [Kibdelosporangium banguiense]
MTWSCPWGRCSSRQYRLLRSIKVAIAEPTIRSPSQCQGTAQSAAFAGRWLISTRSRIRGGRAARAWVCQRG